MNLDDIRLYIDDRPQDGVFRVHKAVYSDPELFELEMKYIFERTWNYLALESELPKPNDYVTRHIGRTPVIVSRNAKGRVGVFINACRHKGATVARLEQGNARYHVCPYHGWAYDAAGKNVDIKDRAAGCYAKAFDDENHDLLPVAKVGIYKGMVFASLSADVPELEDHLGDLRFFLDLHMEQGAQGMEIIPGRAVYSYRANWKMQMENGQDAYHFGSTHRSLVEIQIKRLSSGQGNTDARSFDLRKRASMQGGMFDFPHGHTTGFMNLAEPEKRPIWPQLDEIRSRVGDVKAQWMLKQRNAVFFPNLQIADQVVPILRTFRPIRVDLTELRSFVIAPVGEAPELRAWRLRQFEDVINPGGYATPDDIAVFEDCQSGYRASGFEWLQGYERGMAVVKREGNDMSAEMGVRPLESVYGPLDMHNEVALHAPLREWVRLMEAGLAGKPAY